jgi:predicted metal-dependent HD superfamily phosphohydrolase
METYKENEKRMKLALEKVARLSRDLTQTSPYHNYSHEVDVCEAATRVGRQEGLSDYELFLLRTGALTHDIIVSPGRSDNEEKSAEIIQIYLPRFGYFSEEINETGRIILATKMPQAPKTLMGRIICDADLDNLGREDFLEKSELVREELKIPEGTKWYEGCLALLQNHHYWTQSEKALRDPGKAANIQRLEKMLQEPKC